MLVDLNYVFISLLLVIYCAWQYKKRKERYMLHLTICFTFLTLSAALKTLTFTLWTYIPFSLLELGGLALYAVFAITAIIALKELTAHISHRSSIQK